MILFSFVKYEVSVVSAIVATKSHVYEYEGQRCRKLPSRQLRKCVTTLRNWEPSIDPTPGRLVTKPKSITLSWKINCSFYMQF
jgi:hypothetical protein